MNKTDEIDKFIQRFNRSWSKFNNMSLRKQLEEFYDQIKDNPVPSIDSKNQQSAYILLNAALHELEKTEHPKGSSEICDGIREWFNLQNGVETDKEYPNMKITVPNSFFRYHGINPESCDGFHVKAKVDGIVRNVSFNEEELDLTGAKRASYQG